MKKEYIRKLAGAMVGVLLLSSSLISCQGTEKGQQTQASVEITSATASGVETQTAGETSEESSEILATTQTNAITYTDALGRHLTLEKPSRVASLLGSFTDVWCLAGGKDTLVAAADDSWTQFDLGLAENVQNIGKAKSPNKEMILAAKPDLVLASVSTQANVDMLPVLEEAGIPVVYFEVSTFADYKNMLHLCTRLTGQEEAYETYGLLVEKEIAKTKEAAEQALVGKEGEKVLYLRASTSGTKVKNSKKNVLGEMLADLGTENIADSQSQLLENLSVEAILQNQPDKIFIVLQGNDEDKVRQSLDAELLSNPAWQSLEAVKNGQVFYMDQKLYNLKPNAAWGKAYKDLAEILYGKEG